MKNSATVKFLSLSQNESFIRMCVSSFIAPLNPTIDEIADIKTEFEFLYDGIIKSAINFFDRRDIKDVKCSCEHLALYLKKIGFKKEDDKWTINTDKFFGTDNCVK